MALGDDKLARSGRVLTPGSEPRPGDYSSAWGTYTRCGHTVWVKRFRAMTYQERACPTCHVTGPLIQTTHPKKKCIGCGTRLSSYNEAQWCFSCLPLSDRKVREYRERP